MDRGAWWAAVPRITKSQTRLSDSTFTFHFHASEKEMATHSRVLAWRIPGTGEPGGLPSVGSWRVRHDWSDLAAAAARQETKQWWRWRKWTEWRFGRKNLQAWCRIECGARIGWGEGGTRIIPTVPDWAIASPKWWPLTRGHREVP